MKLKASSLLILSATGLIGNVLNHYTWPKAITLKRKAREKIVIKTMAEPGHGGARL